MNIRKATEEDIPEIVSVLKASLGEKELSLSEEIWRYKHVFNPFGKSVVLIAEEEDKIVGVRAFMRWKWQSNNKTYSAFRAVDTATHPKHQGKGIFKRLTLAAVERVKNEGDHFIFNTPNEMSRPGYLKMGWEPVGKIYIGIKPSLGFLNLRKKSVFPAIQKNTTAQKIDVLCHHWNHNLQKSKSSFTPKSADFLEWRYEKNPLQEYTVIAEDFYYLAVYIKKRGKLKELRVAEFLYNEDEFNREERKKLLKNIEKKFSAHLISFSPQFLELFGKKGYLGPLLVLNDLNLTPEERLLFKDITKWYNSIGDLELF
ncbi:GNAT family N-acetyltransferase [Zunongwangia sp. H14]|uniref:GNAT family N-acetyltransferase n=1 Tax=Zunongwangia sp. H14 TaxID=3240792 RepID=UPI00356ADAD6